MGGGIATNYQRGRAFEYRARDALYKRGAAYVMRAAQSKGKVDLLALWPERPELLYLDGFGWLDVPWLVQCKTGSARMSPAERKELLDLARITGSLPVEATPGPKNRGVTFVNLETKETL